MTARKLIKLIALIIVSACLALLSVKIERRGPELVQFSDMCGPRSDQPCLRPSLKGGYPMAFVVDTPGVSVENQLFFEDRFIPLGFVVDWAVCAAGLWLLFRIHGLRRR